MLPLLGALRVLFPVLVISCPVDIHIETFKPDPGHIKLNQHLASVIALMRASTNWPQFQRSLKRAFPKVRDQLDLDLDDI